MNKPNPCGHGRNFCLECHDATAHVSISTMKEREKWIHSIERAIKCGLPKLLVADLKKVVSGLERSIKYGGTQRLRQRIEELEAQQPASVAVPDCDICHGTRRVKEPGCDEGDCARCLSAAPHPASGEQKPVALRFPTMLRKMWSGGEVQDWLDRQGSLYAAAPAAQDMIGLVKSATAYLNALDSGADEYHVKRARSELRRDLAACRAQQGAHKPSPAFVVSLPVPVKPDEPEEGIDDSWMDGYNGAVRMRAKCVAAIEQAGGTVVQGERP